MRGQAVNSSQFRDAVDTQGITVADLSTAYWAIARDLADSGPCPGEPAPGAVRRRGDAR
jgi:hypothetical protein